MQILLQRVWCLIMVKLELDIQLIHGHTRLFCLRRRVWMDAVEMGTMVLTVLPIGRTLPVVDIVVEALGQGYQETIFL